MPLGRRKKVKKIEENRIIKENDKKTRQHKKGKLTTTKGVLEAFNSPNQGCGLKSENKIMRPLRSNNKSPSQKENVDTSVEHTICPNKIMFENPDLVVKHEEVQVPKFRIMEPLCPLRGTKHCEEKTSSDLYIKRHEKLEREEKAMLRRDLIWQRQEKYRRKLLKMEQEQETGVPEIFIEVYRKLPNT